MKEQLAEQQHVSDVLEAFRKDVKENRLAAELREFLNDPPDDLKALPFWEKIRDHAEKSLQEKTIKEARMEDAHRREQQLAYDEALAEASPTGEDLLSAINALGGLPSKQALDLDRYGDSELRGEVDRIRETARHGSSDGKRGVFYSDLFRNDAPSMDQLRNRLTEHGFDFATVDEMLGAIEESIVTGRKIYGEKSTAAAALADVTPFSRSAKEPKKLKTAQVEDAISRAKARWENLPADAIDVVQSYSDLPDGIREKMQEAGAEGVYRNGKVIIVADKLESPGDALRVAIHEVVGHYGLRGALGEHMNRALDEVALLNTKGVQKVAERLGFDLRDPAQRREAAEEYIAESTHPQRLANVTRFLKGVLQKVFPGLKFQDDYVRQLIQTSREYLESGRRAEATDGRQAPSITIEAETRFSKGADDGEMKAQKKKLGELFDHAIQSGANNDKWEILRSLTPQEAEFISRHAGIDVSDFKHSVDVSGIRHTLAKHGSEKEMLRGQLPITKADIEKVPQILKPPFELTFSTEGKRGLPTFEYKKTLEDRYTYVVEARMQRRRLALITMHKKSGKSTEAPDASSKSKPSAESPETFSGPTSQQNQSTNENRPPQGNLDASGETRLSRGKSTDTSDFPDRGPMVEQGIKGWRRFFDGAADVLKRTKGLEDLGDKVRQHMDRAREVQGKVASRYIRLENKESKKSFQQAEREVETFYREKDGGNHAAAAEIERTMSPAGKKHLAVWRKIAEDLGQWAQRAGVEVQASDGSYRKMGLLEDYHPRMVRKEVIEAVRDPHKHPEMFREVVQEMKKAGLASSAEEVIDIFGSGEFFGEISNDHFGNIEKARQLELPSKLYDYSFEARRRYMLQSIERLAQIEAYGQTGNGKQDAFEQAAMKVRDPRTAEYLQALSDRVYGKTNKNFWNRTMGFLNAVATGSMLANPVTIGVNLGSGMGYTATTFGVRNTLKGLLEARRYGELAMEAREKGVLSEDLMSLQEDADKLGSTAISKAQAISGKFLKYSGYNLSEEIVRTTALGAAKAYVRNALSVYSKNPDGRKARIIEAEFKRMGVDPEKIYKEAGAGSETDKFYRAAVNAGQGGYKVDQTPIYMDTPAGRFFFKYQKWGAQASRNFVLHVAEPLVGRNGPVDIKPLIRYLAVTAVVGAGVQQAKETLFGTPDQEASFEEIARKWSVDQRAAIADAAGKLFSAQLAAGAFGMLGNYSQAFSDVAERSRFKSPLEPAGVGTITNAGEQLFRLFEQGKLTPRDLEDYAKAQISFWRTAVSAAGRAGLRPIEGAKQDARWLAVQTRRFASEMGVTASRTQMGRMAKTPDSPIMQDLSEALLAGDVQGAKDAAARYLDKSRSKEERTARLRSLRQSVYMRQPLRVGSAGEARRELFMNWAKSYLPAEDMTRVRRIDATYRRTAESTGLFTPRTAKPKQILQQQRKWAANADR